MRGACEKEERLQGTNGLVVHYKIGSDGFPQFPHLDIVNGDKPFISLESVDGSALITAKVYGTPWAGKEGWEKNRSAELNGICFLQRGKENKIRKLEPSECLNYLFNQVYLPKDPVALDMTLELADLLTKNVPLYLLECYISEEAVKCSFEGMSGMEYKK
jgi:hypothetical protein